MTVANLQGVAEQVVRRAQGQGYVVPRRGARRVEAGRGARRIVEGVVALARQSLSFRRGRYYYSTPSATASAASSPSSGTSAGPSIGSSATTPRPAATPIEHRGQDRVDFVQTVAVRTDDGEEFTLLSRDLSTTGIRLVGTHRLLGQKVHVLVPRPDGEAPTTASCASCGPAASATACSRTAAWFP